MLERERVAVVFADAWSLYDEAIEILGLGKQRIAAEVAWGATKRATDALILGRTGREPTGTGQTTRGIAYLDRTDRLMAPLARQYNRRIVALHGRCFYSGDCGEVEYLIEETVNYIRSAEELAGAGDEC